MPCDAREMAISRGLELLLEVPIVVAEESQQRRTCEAVVDNITNDSSLSSTTAPRHRPASQSTPPERQNQETIRGL